jgi:hypothetical protein
MSRLPRRFALRCLGVVPVLAVVLVVTPRLLSAQRIAPPSSSSVWSAGSTKAETDSTRNLASTGWTQSKGAAAGGVFGALAGMMAGIWVCHQFGGSGDSGCGANMVWGGALLGGLGLVLGSLAGAEAEQRRH